MELVFDQLENIACRSCAGAVDLSGVAAFKVIACPHCGARLRVPGKLGTLLLQEAIGSGAAGVVYKALDTTLNRLVAVKILVNEGDDSRKITEATLAEARALAAINHPNVVHVYTIGYRHGQAYIVMELLDSSGKLNVMLHEGWVADERRGLETAIDVAQGLRAAHGAGLLHRDVKPGNILFTSEGIAKLLDFSVVHAHNSDGEKLVIGTPYYIAPEAARGEEVDFRADIYSLGATLFHLLTGRPVFEGETPREVVRARLKGRAPDIREVNPGISLRTAKVLARMLEAVASDRHGSYDELIGDLKRALDLCAGPASDLFGGPYADHAKVPHVGPVAAASTPVFVSVEATTAATSVTTGAAPAPVVPPSARPALALHAATEPDSKHEDHAMNDAPTGAGASRWRRTVLIAAGAAIVTAVIFLAMGAGGGDKDAGRVATGGQPGPILETPETQTPRTETSSNKDGSTPAPIMQQEKQPAGVDPGDGSMEAWEKRVVPLLNREPTAWRPVEVVAATSAAGATMTLLDDGSILVGGRSAATDTYEVDVKLDVPARLVTGIRIEAIPDRSLIANGPGRAWQGNFVLTHFKAEVLLAGVTRQRLLEFDMPTADFEQKGYPAAHLTDADTRTGWAVEPRYGRPSSAMLPVKAAAQVPPAPIDPAATATTSKDVLRLTLAQTSRWPKNTLGRFRVTVTTTMDPFLDPKLPARIKSVLAKPDTSRSAAELRELFDFFRKTRIEGLDHQEPGTPVPPTAAQVPTVRGIGPVDPSR